MLIEFAWANLQQPELLKQFAGSRIFKVPTKNFVLIKMLKRKQQRFEEYIGDADLVKEISRYANKNWDNGIVVADEQIRTMCYLRYGKGK